MSGAVRSVLIVGAGGFGRSVADALGAAAAGFVDDRVGDRTPALGLPLLGTSGELARLRRDFTELVVAIGDNRVRRELCELAMRLDFRLAVVVHPHAWVSPHARLGPGTLVMAGATVGTEARSGCGVIVNAGAVVDHHAILGDHVHLGVGVCIGGGARIATGAWLREGVVIGAGEQVEEGAVLSRASGVTGDRMK